MATITKTASGKWQAIIRMAGHGQKKKSFEKKWQAEAWAAEYESLIRAKMSGDPTLADKIFLGDALLKYRADCKLDGKEDSTLALEERASKHLVRIFHADCPLSSINGPRVAQYIKQRQREGATSTIRQELAILSGMYRMARQGWGFNVHNPVDDVKRPSPARGSERILTEQEAEIVLNLARESQNKRFYAYVLLLMHTGMRSGEAAMLHPDHVNLEKRYLRIFETKTDTPRTVPITAPVMEVLKETPVTDAGYYFMSHRQLASSGYQLKPGDIFRSCWRTLYKKIEEQHPKMPHFRVHDLRHTAASHLLMAGVDMRVVADILGHKNLSMMMRYTHLLDDFRQETIDKIGGLGIKG